MVFYADQGLRDGFTTESKFFFLCQADNKLAAARLMRDIAELRQRVAQVEARLSTELKVST